VFTIVST